MNRSLTVDFLSLIFSTLLYILSIIALMYMAYHGSQALPDVKYTKDKDAYMDVYMIDIDDFPTPISPKEISDVISPTVTTDSKEAEEATIKTTSKQTTTQKEAPPKPKEEPKEETKEVIKEPIKEEKKEEKQVVKKEEPKPLSDLFSDVDTKKLDEVAKKEETAIQSRAKSDKETKGTTKTATSSQNVGAKGDVARGKSQRTGVYNEFIGEIESALTNIWSSYRAMPNQDATVELTIDRNGKLSYKILELSYNTEFNQKLRDFLARIERMQFPAPPGGQPYTHKYKMKDLIR